MDRLLRWRLALMGSGLVLAILMCVGGLFESKKAIIIDYGILGDDAIGAEVFIDDEFVGRLVAMRSANRTGFEVSEGVHTVRIVHPDLGCEPIRVETQGSQMNLLLILDVADFYDRGTGRSEPRIVFDG